MGTVDIIRLNIKINAIKIISLWLTTGIMFFKAGSMYKDFISRMDKYDKYETEIKQNKIAIDSLERWRNDVTAYYLPKK